MSVVIYIYIYMYMVASDLLLQNNVIRQILVYCSHLGIFYDSVMFGWRRVVEFAS